MTNAGPKFPKDVLDWDEHKLHVDCLDELSDIEKHHARNSFDYLKQALGPNFLRKIHSREVAKHGPHPFMSYVINYAAWTRRYFTRLAEAMRSVEESENYPKLIRELEDPDRFTHNVLVLQSSAKLVQEGLQARFEPTLPIENGRKQPDAKFENAETQESIFLEVAILYSAKEAIQASEAMNSVSLRLMMMPFGFRWAGRLSKIPAPAHMLDIVSRIDRAIARATAENSFVEIIEEGTFEIGMCPEDQVDLLSAWSQPRGLQPGSFEGPRYDDNVLSRLRRKIQTEQEQLPHTEPNAILIHATDFFIRMRDIRAAINDLEEEVYAHAHVPLVIITGSHIGGSDPEVIQKDQHRYTKRAVDPLYVEHSF